MLEYVPMSKRGAEQMVSSVTKYILESAIQQQLS